MQDSTVADKRFYISYPSDRSRSEEIWQVLLDLLKHEQRIADFGPRKAFPSVVERKRLYDILERYGLPIDDPTELIDTVLSLRRKGGTTCSQE